MRNFLKFIKSLHSNRYEVMLQKIIDQQIPCALFATKWTMQSRLELIDKFRALDVNMNILFSADKKDFENPPSNIELYDISAPPPRKLKPKFVFFPGGAPVKATIKRFIEFGVEPIRIESTGSTKSLFDFYIDHIDDLFEIYESLSDNASKSALLNHVLGGISRNFSFYHCVENSEYILDGFIPQPSEIVIDGGSADGATASMFADLGCRVIAFEMDRDNVEISRKVASEKNFVVENLGLGNSDRTITYSHNDQNLYSSFVINSGASLLNLNGSEKREASIIKLDSYVRQKNLPRIDFIKLSIVGAEPDALRGAANTIARFKPKIAIQIRSKPTELFQSYKILKQICPDYEFAFRHFETTVDNYPSYFTEEIREYCESQNLPLRCVDENRLILFAR